MDGRNAFPCSVPTACATGVSPSWELVGFDWTPKGLGRSYSSLLGGSSATIDTFPSPLTDKGVTIYHTYVTGPNQPGWHIVRVRTRRQRRLMPFSKELWVDLSWEQIPSGARLWFKPKALSWREALWAEALRCTTGRSSLFGGHSRPNFTVEKLRIGDRV